MSDEKLKEEIKQVVTNLGNIKFTVEDELEFCKQVLKRKEQECEELKIYIESNEQQVKEVETLVMDNDRLINELNKLKAENEELKKIIERLDVPKHEVIDMDIALENEKLKQTLAEIKEIANYSFNLSTSELMAKLEQILQKISGCKVENEGKQ